MQIWRDSDNNGVLIEPSYLLAADLVVLMKIFCIHKISRDDSMSNKLNFKQDIRFILFSHKWALQQGASRKSYKKYIFLLHCKDQSKYF